MSRFIRIIDDALAPELCADAIRRFEASPERKPGATGSGVDLAMKRSTDIVIGELPAWNDLLSRVLEAVDRALVDYAKRFPALVAGALSPVVVDPASGNPVALTLQNFGRIGHRYAPALLRRAYRHGRVNLQKYDQGEGGYPHWHSEIFPQEVGTDALHRALFWIGYLNDVAAGGETEFLHQDVKVQPRAGRIVIAPAGFTHTHRGNAPLSGDKYVVTSWLLFRRGEELYSRR